MNASGHVQIAKPVVESSRKIQTAAVALSAALSTTDIPADIMPSDLRVSDLESQLQSLNLATEKLDILAKLLQEPNPVNIEKWDGQYVNLYYFDDVPRLMKVLLGEDATTGVKTVGGIATAGASSAHAHESAFRVDRVKHRGRPLVQLAIVSLCQTMLVGRRGILG